MLPGYTFGVKAVEGAGGQTGRQGKGGGLLKPLIRECGFHEVRGSLFGGYVLNSFEEVRLRKRPYQWQEKTAAFARIPFVE